MLALANRRRVRCLATPALLIALALLASACAQHPLGPAPDPGFDYVAYTSPDGLVENFARSWRNMDIDEYGRGLLYDGTLPAPDGRRYAPFVFYTHAGFEGFERLDYEEELARIGRMFSGNPGRAPGVESIELDLQRLGAWELLPARGALAGDVYPAGSLRAVFAPLLTLRLKASAATGAQRVLSTRRQQELVLIPVQGEGLDTEYRLWKWWERGEATR